MSNLTCISIPNFNLNYFFQNIQAIFFTTDSLQPNDPAKQTCVRIHLKNAHSDYFATSIFLILHGLRHTFFPAICEFENSKLYGN